MNRWEKLTDKLKGIEFKGVSGSLFFSDAEAWLSFKKHFKPKVGVPDYLLHKPKIYETGDMHLLGIYFQLYGSDSTNPNFTPSPTFPTGERGKKMKSEQEIRNKLNELEKEYRGTSFWAFVADTMDKAVKIRTLRWVLNEPKEAEEI